MADVLVYSANLGIVVLVALIFYRVFSLHQKYYPADKNTFRFSFSKQDSESLHVKDEYRLKMESLKQAQIFSGTQMLEIKRSYGDISQEKLAWLREAISLYLIGAVDLIGKQAQCGTATRKELISLVLKSNLNLTEEATGKYFSEALYRTCSSENDLMVRAGAKAAKSWISDSKIPQELTLNAQLNEWGVFA